MRHCTVYLGSKSSGRAAGRGNVHERDRELLRNGGAGLSQDVVLPADDSIPKDSSERRDFIGPEDISVSTDSRQTRDTTPPRGNPEE